MAVTQNNEKYVVRVDYKSSYDDTGLLGYPDWALTFTQVKETATPAQLYDFANALLSLTKYYSAPYKISLIATSELVDA